MKRIFKVTCLSLLLFPLATFSQFPFKGEVPLAAPFAPCMPCYNFTGYYVGANVGWKWVSYKTTFETDAFSVDGTTTPPQEFEIDAHPNSFTGGGQVGYNLQLRQFLFGFEADWNSQSAGDDETVTSDASTVFVAGDSFKTKTRWENSYRLRLGYVYRNWLFYGTAGISRINFHLSANLLDTNGETIDDTEGRTSTGETIGFGTEYALTRYWSVGLEYRYAIYPGKNIHLQSLTVADGVTTPVTASVRGLNTNQVLFKVNFRVYA
ncbi:MAG TPA: outer membrane beta-barrel protein [Gammaproteobacteria bacterium]|jgi:outer membrane immunogenic protein|nr:outer membrane beta-barrel protein [Gammaproteobacteria bacterium]